MKFFLNTNRPFCSIAWNSCLFATKILLMLFALLIDNCCISNWKVKKFKCHCYMKNQKRYSKLYELNEYYKRTTLTVELWSTRKHSSRMRTPTWKPYNLVATTGRCSGGGRVLLPKMNKFEWVSSDHHPMSLAGNTPPDLFWGSGYPT